MTSPEISFPPSGVVRLTGRDVTAVLQNISTQRFDDLGAGDARLALFCDFRGRLLYRVMAANLDDGIWLIREDAAGAPLAEYLDRNVFREDVRIEDLSAAWQVRSHPEKTGVEARLERGAAGIRIEIPGVPRYELTPTDRGAGGGESAADWNARRIAAGWARHG